MKLSAAACAYCGKRASKLKTGCCMGRTQRPADRQAMAVTKAMTDCIESGRVAPRRAHHGAGAPLCYHRQSFTTLGLRVVCATCGLVLRRLAAAVLIAHLLTACGAPPAGPSILPTKPPVVAPPVVEAPGPEFDDGLWRELVYNAYDKPGDMAGRISWVMPTASPNVYIRTTNLEPSDLEYMRREIPRIVHQVTGQVYTGRVEYGTDEVERLGWILIRTVTREQAPEFITGRFCGYARIGRDPGRVWIVKEAGCRLSRMLAHELGHGLGLYHVGDAGAVMRQASSAVRFTPAELHHSELAYRAGRGVGYCGNPETCTGRSFTAAPAFVVD